MGHTLFYLKFISQKAYEKPSSRLGNGSCSVVIHGAELKVARTAILLGFIDCNRMMEVVG